MLIFPPELEARLPLPQTQQMADLAAAAFVSWQRSQEQLVRDLLGQWVSELEPVILYDRSAPAQIRGIGAAGYPPTVVVPNPQFRPGLMDLIFGVRD